MEANNFNDAVPLIESQDLTKKRAEEIPLDAHREHVEELSKPCDDLSEKPAKVQRTTGFFGGVFTVSSFMSGVISNFASGITTASQTVVEQAKGVGKAVQKSIEDNTLIGGFNKMQQEFIQEKQAQERGPGVAPWVGGKNENELKKQILAVSGDKRNFLRDPPAGANFEFDLASAMPVAAILMQEDPELDKRRFDLVPKKYNCEAVFWRNYFYRISLIKQSSALSADAPELEEKDKQEGELRDDVSVASNLDLMDGSVVGDSDTVLTENPLVVEATNCPISSGKPFSDAGGSKGTEDTWEQELQQTLDSYEVVGGEPGDNELELDQALTDEQHLV